MSAMIIGVVLLLLVGLGVGIYFLMNAKKCKDHGTQGECKDPCQWDTYGGKCIDEGDSLTPAPAPAPAPTEQADPTSSARTGGSAPEGTPSDDNKWKCYAGRYGAAYAEYQENNSFDDVKDHFDTIGKSKGWKTTCNLTPDEVACYTLQNPEVFENFGYQIGGTQQRNHYKDVGRDAVARFNCVGGKLGDSTIPDNASIATPREFSINQQHGAYTDLLVSPNGVYRLRIYRETRRARLFLTKGNNNIVTIFDSQLSQSDYNAGYTKLRGWFSGSEGNLYFRWYKENGRDGYKSPVYINTYAPGTTNNTVTSNQHVIVLTDSGKLYIDHGLGAGEEAVIIEADE